MRGFARIYGAGPLHLLSALASFVVAGYAVVKIRELGAPGNVAVWFAGAIIAHDLVLLPLYSLVQMAASRLARVGAGGSAPGAPPPRVLLLNHLLVPAMISGLLLLLFFPSIMQRNERYPGASGLDADVYLERWLALSATLFVLSGLLYAIGLGLRRARETG